MHTRQTMRKILCNNQSKYYNAAIIQAGRLTNPKNILSTPWITAFYCTNTNQNQTNQPSVILRDLSERRLVAPLRSGQEHLRNKFNSMYKSYEDYSMASDVRHAHSQVEHIQEELRQAQERRRDISKELNGIRHELQLIYADLANCKKGEPRYLEIVRKEYDTHHQEQQKLMEFELQDKTERDLFMHLQAAVKTSHEKEKMHANSAKYWSIVGSLLGALLGICGTLFSFYNRNNTITTMLEQVKEEYVVLNDQTKAIEGDLKKLISLNQTMYDKQLLEQQQRDQKDVLLAKEMKNVATQSWSSWTYSWSNWVGRNMGIIYAYRYFVPKKLE